MNVEDRIVGSLVGGILGDALGCPYEGQAPPIIPSWDREHWAVSDDSQLTVATCEAIIEAGGIVAPAKIAEVFERWFRAGRFTGLGSSTLRALMGLAAGGHWALVGASGEKAAGNGAAMRIAPIAFLVDPTTSNGRRQIREIAQITHRNDEAYAGAMGVAMAISVACTGMTLLDSLPDIVETLPDSILRDQLRSIGRRDLSESLAVLAPTGVSGFSADTVAIATAISIYFSDDLRGGVDAAVRAGGDTDTVASIVGQIIGARVGGEEALEIADFEFQHRREFLGTIKSFAECVSGQS